MFDILLDKQEFTVGCFIISIAISIVIFSFSCAQSRREAHQQEMASIGYCWAPAIGQPAEYRPCPSINPAERP